MTIREDASSSNEHGHGTVLDIFGTLFMVGAASDLFADLRQALKTGSSKIHLKPFHHTELGSFRKRKTETLTALAVFVEPAKNFG